MNYKEMHNRMRKLLSGKDPDEGTEPDIKEMLESGKGIALSFDDLPNEMKRMLMGKMLGKAHDSAVDSFCQGIKLKESPYTLEQITTLYEDFVKTEGKISNIDKEIGKLEGRTKRLFCELALIGMQLILLKVGGQDEDED